MKLQKIVLKDSTRWNILCKIANMRSGHKNNNLFVQRSNHHELSGIISALHFEDIITGKQFFLLSGINNSMYYDGKIKLSLVREYYNL